MGYLTVYTHGIKTAKGKSAVQGYCAITAKQGGTTLCDISVDTFEGTGKNFKERENPIIDTYLPNTHGKRWTGTADELKALLYK